MSLFADLPLDITSNILRFAAYGYNSDIVAWMSSLQLLAVCREWRAIARERVFKHVMINCYGVNDGGFRDVFTGARERTINVLSNLKIITKSGLSSGVSHLCINIGSGCYNVQAVSAICKHITSKTGYSTLDDALDEVDYQRRHGANPKDALEEVEFAISDVASHILSTAPNITCLMIHTSNDHYYQARVFTEIVRQCSAKLVKLNYNAQVGGQSMFNFPKLKDLLIGPRATKLLSHIEPANLQSVTLTLGITSFAWNLFRGYSQTDVMEFNNLEQLKIIGNDSTFGSRVSMSSDCRLEAPKLKLLDIQNTPFEADSYAEFLRQPVEALYFTGKISDALTLCNQNISSLKTLRLTFKLDTHGSTSTTEIMKMNEIFHKTSSIPSVCCVLDLDRRLFNWAVVDWPHLTYLQLSGVTDLCSTIRAVIKMTNLVGLTLDYSSSYCPTIAYIPDYVNTIMNEYPEPTNSSIKFLMIDIEHEQDKNITNALNKLVGLFPDIIEFGCVTR